MAHAYLNAGKTRAPELFCGKVGLPSRVLARRAMNSMRGGAAQSTANGSNHHNRMGVYLCKSCANYHIGHQG